MSYRTTCGALLLAALPTAGCGTVANLARPTGPDRLVTPFGGVKHDVSSFHDATRGSAGDDARPQMEQCKQVARAIFCAVDVPFSLVGDAVVWPYTKAYNYINSPALTTPLLLITPPAPPADAAAAVPLPTLTPPAAYGPPALPPPTANAPPTLPPPAADMPGAKPPGQ